METVIDLAALTDIQKHTLRARYLPALKSAKRSHVIFGTIYWTCMTISVLGSIAVTTFLASGASKKVDDTINYVFAVLSSVVGSMMILVKSLKINEFYFNGTADDLEALIWILIGSPVPDWESFVDQFNSIQKRERGRLQEIAAEIQTREIRPPEENA